MAYILLYIIGGIVIISFISWLYEKYKKSKSDRRRKRLDHIAFDMLADFDFNKEKDKIKSIGSRYVSEEYICPKCNGMLVIRNGIYGKFWGCNHYPECKYTRNI